MITTFLALALSIATPETVRGDLREVSFSPTASGEPYHVRVTLKGSQKKYQIDAAKLTFDGKVGSATEFLKWAATAESPVGVVLDTSGYLGAVKSAKFHSSPKR